MVRALALMIFGSLLSCADDDGACRAAEQAAGQCIVWIRSPCDEPDWTSEQIECLLQVQKDDCEAVESCVLPEGFFGAE